MIRPSQYKNHLLRKLPKHDLDSISSDLQLVKLTLRQTIHDAAAVIQYIYFPEDVLASVITVMRDGNMVEMAMIGSEGIVGIPALLGIKTSDHHVITQVDGHAYRMEVGACKKLFDQSGSFRNSILKFTNDFINIAGQTGACNRLHSIEQRCARWLLMSTDRMASDNIPMTHEFLSAMLGARRAGVTETAGEFQRMGLIRYHHGQLNILDRKGLENIACECYHTDHMRLGKLQKS